MFLMFSLFGLLLVLVYWWHWRWSNRRMLQLAAAIPGPPTLPIIGNAHMFLTETTEQLKKIAAYFDIYGEYVRFWLGPELNIAVKNPADIKLLLTSNKVNHKGPLYNFMVSLIGPGILSGGATWRNNRKIVTPTYNKKSVQAYMYVFNEEADNLAKSLGRKGNYSYDVYHVVVNSTTNCVCQTLMGLSKEEFRSVNRLEEVVRKTQEMYDVIFMTMTRWWLQVPFIYWLTGMKKQRDQYIKMLDDFTSDIVRRRRKALKNSGAYDDIMGVVDRFILSGGLTEQEIKWETFTLFTTSQEAAAKMTSGVLLFLAHLPEWQQKVYDEVLSVVGSHEEVNEQHLKELHHLDMVFKETLRYFSIAGFIQRTVDEEVSIQDGRITLPVGTSLVIPIHEVHRDPKNWEDPLKVKPERFLPENVKKRDPNAFIPFSLGHMDCLGRVYATALIKTLVVYVVRSNHLEADGSLDDIELQIAISVKSAKGYNIRTRPRNNDIK